MDYNIINALAAKGLSTRKIAKELQVSASTVKYWLKKFDIKTISRSEVSDYRFCPRCKIEKLKDEFYNRRNGKGNSVYCKHCSNNQTVERQKRFKQQCIEYKGGKCVSCGYKKCNNVLEFHHLDPSKKEFSIAHAKLTSFNEKVKRELDNCALVCANCHREIHAGFLALLDYKIS
jgi:predicted transcriptional regulator